MSMSWHANFIKGGGVQWFKQCSEYFLANINLKNKHDKLFYFISNDWSFYVYLLKKYPKMTVQWRECHCIKNPNLRCISFLPAIDAHRVSIKNTSCICDYFLPDYLFMYILYDNYFDTPNNALNMLDNIWGFLL